MNTDYPFYGEWSVHCEGLEKAQENLRRSVEAEIDRLTKQNCRAWMNKVISLLTERSTLLKALGDCKDFLDCPQSVKVALELAKLNDEQWFKNRMTGERYAQMLRDAFI